jgi:hypothetical protein
MGTVPFTRFFTLFAFAAPKPALLPMTLKNFMLLGGAERVGETVRLKVKDEVDYMDGGRSMIHWDGALIGDFDAELTISLVGSKVERGAKLKFYLSAGVPDASRQSGFEMLLEPGPKGLEDGRVSSLFGKATFPLSKAGHDARLMIRRRGSVFEAYAAPRKGAPLLLGRKDLHELSDARLAKPDSPVTGLDAELDYEEGVVRDARVERSPEALSPNWYSVTAFTVRRPR